MYSVEKVVRKAERIEIRQQRQSLDEFDNSWRHRYVEGDADEVMPILGSDHEVKEVVADFARREVLRFAKLFLISR